MTRVLLALLLAVFAAAQAQAKERLFVLTDIGNEPDDQMSLVRLLVYSNEIDIEGIVATTSTWQREKVSPEIAASVIDAYGKVLPNLKLHANGWPEASDLQNRVTRGVANYGMAALKAAPLSDGAKALIAAVDRADQRPLWINLWGGGNTLAQALIHVRNTRSQDQIATFVGNMRVYSISDQDDAGPWIRREFPDLFYIVSPSTPDSGDYASATWTGISGDQYYLNGAGADFETVSNAWLDKHIRNKGPLGRAYPKYMFIMEGDTPAFLGLIPNGLNVPGKPNWGGWGGRYLWRQPYGETRPVWTQGGDMFLRASSADTVNGVTSDQATIWRWRDAFQRDFAARMDWTVEPFAEANHPPVPKLAVRWSASSETNATPSVMLDATGSTDPDGNRLTYRWFHYAEAGVASDIELADVEVIASGPRAKVVLKSACRKAWIDGLVPCKGRGVAHIILAVTDNGKPALTRYERFVFQAGTDR